MALLLSVLGLKKEEGAEQKCDAVALSFSLFHNFSSAVSSFPFPILGVGEAEVDASPGKGMATFCMLSWVPVLHLALIRRSILIVTIVY